MRVLGRCGVSCGVGVERSGELVSEVVSSTFVFPLLPGYVTAFALPVYVISPRTLQLVRMRHASP